MQLLTLDNFRENEQLSKYGDAKSARKIMLLDLKKLIEANPLFRDKLVSPSLRAYTDKSNFELAAPAVQEPKDKPRHKNSIHWPQLFTSQWSSCTCPCQSSRHSCCKASKLCSAWSTRWTISTGSNSC